jgi:AraC family transcriptional regulator
MIPRVSLLERPAGIVEVRREADHTITIHAGAAVRGACQSQSFVYNRGDLDLWPAGSSDEWSQQQASTSLVLRFAPSMLTRVAEDIGIDARRAGLEPRNHFRDPGIEHIAWALQAEQIEGSPTGELYAESLFHALATRLLQAYAANTTARGGLAKRELQRLQDYIEGHLDQKLSLVHLASLANVSVSHLKKAFRQSTGVPVHNYVMRRRVERAKSLLLEGKMSGMQVALESGFAHPSHMARCMKAHLGLVPSALARANRG